MADESLLTPAVRALVGRASAAVPVRVTARAVRRVSETYGVAPRDLVVGDPVPGIVLVALQGDSESVAMPDLMPNSLLIANDMELERPVLLGETLLVQSRVADISERLGGRFGQSLYVRTENVFTTEGGEVVARSSQTMMHYDASSAGQGGDE